MKKKLRGKTNGSNSDRLGRELVRRHGLDHRPLAREEEENAESPQWQKNYGVSVVNGRASKSSRPAQSKECNGGKTKIDPRKCGKGKPTQLYFPGRNIEANRERPNHREPLRQREGIVNRVGRLAPSPWISLSGVQGAFRMESTRNEAVGLRY